MGQGIVAALQPDGSASGSSAKVSNGPTEYILVDKDKSFQEQI